VDSFNFEIRGLSGGAVHASGVGQEFLYWQLGIPRGSGLPVASEEFAPAPRFVVFRPGIHVTPTNRLSSFPRTKAFGDNIKWPLAGRLRHEISNSHMRPAIYASQPAPFFQRLQITDQQEWRMYIIISANPYPANCEEGRPRD